MKKLSPLKLKTPKELINTLDIETDSEGNLLDIGYTLDSGYHVSGSWYKFITDVSAYDNKKITFHAHNGGGFDYVGLVIELFYSDKYHDLILDYQASLISGKIIVLELELFNGNKLVFLDSARLLPGSLETLGQTFGLGGKDEIPAEYKSNMGEYKRLYPEKYYSYLRRDVILLKEILERTRETLNEISPIGELPVSIGSASLKIFRSRYIQNPIKLPTRKENDFILRGYKGGRTEYFGYGKKNGEGYYTGATYIDRNSMYPAEMLKNVFPIHPGVWRKKLPIDSQGNIEYGFYEVDYEQPQSEKVIAILQPEYKKGESMPYQYSGHGVYSHVELMLLLKHGGKITKFYQGISYDCLDYVFRDFVSEIYGLRIQARLDGNSVFDLVYKNVLNNLYGKFAQGEYVERLKPLTDEEQKAYIDNGVKVSEFAGSLCGVEEFSEVHHRFPVWSAMITAFSRVALTQAAIDNRKGLLYCDTDSLIIQGKPKGIELDSNKLGSWKVEHENIDIIIYGKKSYHIKGKKLKSKGIPTNSINTGNLENHGVVRHLRDSDYYEAEYTRPMLIKSAIRKGVNNPNKFFLYHRKINKHQSTNDRGL